MMSNKLFNFAVLPFMILFMGDSITDGWNYNKDLLPEHSIVRGVVSGTSNIMLLYDDLIRGKDLKHVYIMVGINEIYDEENILKNYKSELDFITTYRSEVHVHIISILPVRCKTIDNEQIIKVNKQIQALVMTYPDKKVEYIDVYNKFCDTDGKLKKELTRDGVHLTRAGYELLKENL